MPPKNPLTVVLHDKIISLYKKGYTIKDIWTSLEVSHQTIMYVLHKENIMRKTGRIKTAMSKKDEKLICNMYLEGYPLSMICEKFPRLSGTRALYRILKNHKIDSNDRKYKKVCKLCGKVEGEVPFYSHLKYKCKICAPMPSQVGSITYRNKAYRKKYGLTVADYEAMLKAQCNKCAICGISVEKTNKRKIFDIDHDHKTGKIRGLLCHTCNVSLNPLENKDWLEKAFSYLEKY